MHEPDIREHHARYLSEPDWLAMQRARLCADDPKRKFRGFSEPGENRQLSILHGLEDIEKNAQERDFVFIHDAARPLLSERQITDCLKVAADHDGAIPVLPVKDTVYASADGKTVCSLLRLGHSQNLPDWSARTSTNTGT